jgi:phospholipid/cholesterol/gamma-HCH transport system substrate-binding protein
LTPARIAAIGGVVVAAVLVGVLMLSASDKYSVTATFQTAGQLVKGNEVQVGGKPVGKVTSIDLTDDGQAEIEMEVDSEFEPLHEGTHAVIRVGSLSGIAGRYVSLTPGPNDAAEIEDGGQIDADDTTTPVDLDQLFNTLDPKTRKGLQRIVQGGATQYDGKAAEANKAAKYFNPALSTSSRLTNELIRDDKRFESFIVDTATVVGAIAERRDDLADLVSNANTTARAIGDENAALARALGLLPPTLRKANTTFVNLRAALGDLDVLVDESKPATKDLAPFLRALRPLVTDAEPTIRDLRFLVKKEGPGNDLIDLTRKQPKLAKRASVAFPRSIRALQKAQPVIEYIRPYTPDLAGWLTKFGQGASNYDAHGHFARIQPMFNAFSLTSSPLLGQVLTPTQNATRLEGLETGQSFRCPGGATQPPPDGSAPWRDTDGNLACDPSTVPPGP